MEEEYDMDYEEYSDKEEDLNKINEEDENEDDDGKEDVQ